MIMTWNNRKLYAIKLKGKILWNICSGAKGINMNFFGCISRYIDVSLLKDATFIGMCLSVVLMSVGCPYMLYFLPAYALSAGEFRNISWLIDVWNSINPQIQFNSLNRMVLGFTKKEAGMLVAVSAVLDLVGRLGFGYLSDLQIFDRKKAFIVWWVWICAKDCQVEISLNIFFDCLQYFGCRFGSVIDSIGKSFVFGWVLIGCVWIMFGRMVFAGSSAAGRLIWNGAYKFELRIDSNVPECGSNFSATIGWIPKRFDRWLRNMFLLHGCMHVGRCCAIVCAHINGRAERRCNAQFRGERCVDRVQLE